MLKYCISVALSSLLYISTTHAAVTTSQSSPAFNLPSIGSKQVFSSSQLRGKVVLIDFWASWCIPCRASFSVYNKLQKQYRAKGFEIVAISVDKDLAAAQRFITQNPSDFVKLHDAQSTVVSQFEPPTMPSSYLVDRQGKVVKVFAGFKKSDEAELKALIERLL